MFTAVIICLVLQRKSFYISVLERKLTSDKMPYCDIACVLSPCSFARKIQKS